MNVIRKLGIKAYYNMGCDRIAVERQRETLNEERIMSRVDEWYLTLDILELSFGHADKFTTKRCIGYIRDYIVKEPVILITKFINSKKIRRMRSRK